MTVREMDRWHTARLPIKQLTRRCIRSGPGQINRVPTTKVLVSLFTHEMCAMKYSLLVLFWVGVMGAISPSQAGMWQEALGVVKNGVNLPLQDQTRKVPKVPATVPVSDSIGVPPMTVNVVSFGDRNILIQALAQITDDAARNSRRSNFVVLALVVLASIFGVIALAAAFFKASAASAVCALLTAFFVTANLALPFRDDVEANRVVAARSQALWRDAILNAWMKKEDYIEYRRKLEALTNYADGKASSESRRTLDNLLYQVN